MPMPTIYEESVPVALVGAKRGIIIPLTLPSRLDPVLLVEGPTDVAACESLGLAAVGRPSNTGGAKLIAQLLARRDVLVVGENDQNPAGSWLRRDGAETLAGRRGRQERLGGRRRITRSFPADTRHARSAGPVARWIDRRSPTLPECSIRRRLRAGLWVHPGMPESENGPFMILLVDGEQGSAKSTLCRLIRSLIDPNKAPLRCEPKDNRDLAIAANSAWMVGLDNISKLPESLSNALCRLATGGGFSTRILYTGCRGRRRIRRPALRQRPFESGPTSRARAIEALHRPLPRWPGSGRRSGDRLQRRDGRTGGAGPARAPGRACSRGRHDRG